MTEETFFNTLNSGRLTLTKRDSLVNVVMLYPELVAPLITAIEKEDREGTFNASWVFDNVMRKKLMLLLPHIDHFVKMALALQSESCIRPTAHVCQLLTQAYYVKKKTPFVKNLDENHLEQMATACFDWLIGEHKVAAKVFAMTSLLHLGKSFAWIHPELKLVLQDTIAQGTSGYKHRGKKTLDQLIAMGY